jgi:hypothetical protein
MQLKAADENNESNAKVLTVAEKEVRNMFSFFIYFIILLRYFDDK